MPVSVTIFFYCFALLLFVSLCFVSICLLNGACKDLTYTQLIELPLTFPNTSLHSLSIFQIFFFQIKQCHPSQLLLMEKFGVSFSGGGTRSAAFCSGVLRRLLQKEIQIDYLSCVSGGGCSGSAYVDWKYRHGKKDNKRWHQEFFNHLRENAGLVCNFQKPCRGFVEFVVICAMILFVSVIAPFLLWGSYAYPLAFFIDYVFGDVLRGGTRSCHEVARESPNITFEDCEESRQTSYINNSRFVLFAVPVGFAFICFVLKGYVQRGKKLLNWLLLLSASLFGILFLPWFFYVSLLFLPDWVKIVLVIPILFLWISFPLVRRNATLMVVIYLYSFAIHSRVFR